jgi:hypothetical protein
MAAMAWAGRALRAARITNLENAKNTPAFKPQPSPVIKVTASNAVPGR